LTEALHRAVELLGELRHLALRELLEAEALHEVLDLPRRHALDIRFDDDMHQRLLGSPAGLKKPARKVGAVTKLRNLKRNGSGSGIPRPDAIAVAIVDAVGAGLAVPRAADRVDLRAHDSGHHLVEHFSKRIRGLFDLLAQPLESVDRVLGGHLVLLWVPVGRRFSQAAVLAAAYLMLGERAATPRVRTLTVPQRYRAAFGPRWAWQRGRMLRPLDAAQGNPPAVSA